MRLAFIFDDHILQHEPLGPMHIASYARQRGHDVEYFNASDAAFRDELRRFPPDVLGYSIATGQQGFFLELNRSLRGQMPGVRMSIFGGPHPTFFPDMIRAPGVDAICIGEGEMPTAELLDALAGSGDFTRIKNLHFKLPDGAIVTNPARDFIQDLDSLPFPDHDIKQRFPSLTSRRMGFFIAGRGCPYRCSFCFNESMMTMQGGRYVRFRDPERVCDEIVMVRDKYGIEVVSFHDDILGLDVNWLERFSVAYRRRVKLPFQCHYRADLASPRSMKALYDAGCVRVVVGLESGDPGLRERVLAKRVTNEQLEACARMARQYGIEFTTQNMFGIPGETVETALTTIRLNIRLCTDIFVHYFFTPYPMTKLAAVAQQMGQFDGDYDKLPLSYHSRMTLEMPARRQIEQIGLCSYLLIDQPAVFRMTSALFKAVKNERLRLLWLKLLRRIDEMTRPRRLRGRTCMYREPRRAWPFHENTDSPARSV
ncbi:MAG: radical SAM protein [Candidatus Sumerlaeota bacterium]|nr:radical SAM protein [Candidatus Sumerlaeota bacterium]